MYTMDADGVVFHDLSKNDPSCVAIGTRATLELNKAGSMNFTLPPGNVVYNTLKKRRSRVTLYQDDEIVFRGRVLETASDLSNMRECYCEGDLSVLRNSVQTVDAYEGTAADYLRRLISDHNSVVGFTRDQFYIGTISAVSDDDTVTIEGASYRDTLDEIQTVLLNQFGGYLRVRYVGSTMYLDYIKEYTGSSGQSIKFGVNLIDVEDRTDTFKAFSVLLPLGKTVDGKRVTIADVNGGSIYLPDVFAVADYGYVVKVESFPDIDDPQALMDAAQAVLDAMKASRSLMIRAVDMHIVDSDTDSLSLGDKVKLDSAPHGLDETEICSKVVLPIDMPEQAEYTFGAPPETLTDITSSMTKKLSQYGSDLDNFRGWLTVTDEVLTLTKQQLDKNTNLVTSVTLEMDSMRSSIEAKADQSKVDELSVQLTNAILLIDGQNAKINAKADLTYVDQVTERISQAEVLIDGQNAKIEAKANQSTVNALGQQITSAFLLIDGQNSKIEAKADTVRVEALATEITGLLKVSNLQAAIADLSEVAISTLSVGGRLDCTNLYAHGAGTIDGHLTVTGGLNVGGEDLDSATLTMGTVASGTIFGAADINLSHSHAVTVNDDGTVTLGEVATTGGSFNIADTQYFKDGVSAAKKEGASSVTLTVRGWQNSSNVVEASNGKSAVVVLPKFSVTGGDTFIDRKTTVYFNTPSVTGYLQSKTVDATPVYNNGWNECRDAYTIAPNIYRISENAPGTLYMQISSGGSTYYTSVGSDWVKVTPTTAYYRPAEKT